MVERTKQTTSRRYCGFALATLLIAGLTSTALADTTDGKGELVASAQFSAYRDVKEYAEKYTCENPSDTTVNQCAIARTATEAFYQTDYCGKVDEDGACVLSSVAPEDVSRGRVCSTSTSYDCSPRAGRFCVEIKCTTCCGVNFPFLDCSTICRRGDPWVDDWSW